MSFLIKLFCLSVLILLNNSFELINELRFISKTEVEELINSKMVVFLLTGLNI